jgi:hypothetical protein
MFRPEDYLLVFMIDKRAKLSALDRPMTMCSMSASNKEETKKLAPVENANLTKTPGVGTTGDAVRLGLRIYLYRGMYPTKSKYSADTWNQSEEIVLPPNVVENLEIHL